MNCYNIGKIIGTSGKSGGILGQDSFKKGSFINCCYLLDTAEQGVGNRNEIDIAKDKEFITTEFVVEANKNEVLFLINKNENDGYPVLKQ